jgi:hypothetical protein
VDWNNVEMVSIFVSIFGENLITEMWEKFHPEAVNKNNNVFDNCGKKIIVSLGSI